MIFKHRNSENEKYFSADHQTGYSYNIFSEKSGKIFYPDPGQRSSEGEVRFAFIQRVC